MVITCTYSTNLDAAFDHDVAKFNASIERSVQAAKVACDKSDKPSFVIGSVGPYAQSQVIHGIDAGSEYTGIYPRVDELSTAEEKEAYYREFHKPRLTALLNNPDVDIIGLETIPRIDEALAAAKFMCEQT